MQIPSLSKYQQEERSAEAKEQCWYKSKTKQVVNTFNWKGDIIWEQPTDGEVPVTACIPSPRATPLRACSLFSSALGPHDASPPGTHLCSCSDQTMLFTSMQRGAHRKDLSHPALRARTQRTQQDRDQQAHTAQCGDPKLAQQNDFKSSAETSQRES